MKPGSILTPATIAARMQPLPRRHRIAHLRALIRRAPVHSLCGGQLTALLRDEMSARPAQQNRAARRSESTGTEVIQHGTGQTQQAAQADKGS